MIRALSFDVDGTLFDLRQMKVAFAWTALRHARFLKAFLRAREEVRALGALPDVRLAQDERVAERLGVPLDEARALSARIIDGEWVEVFDRVKPIPGVRDALGRFHARGLLLATVSDYPAAPKLARLKLDHVPWKADCGAELLGALKPHPRAFEAAVAALGVPADEILHVGDRLDADVAGAHAVGMRAALFTGGNATRHPARPGARDPDFVFEDYAALVEFVERQA